MTAKNWADDRRRTGARQFRFVGKLRFVSLNAENVVIGGCAEEDRPARDIGDISENRTAGDLEQNGDARPKRLEMPKTKNVATLAESPFAHADAQVAIERKGVGLEIDKPHRG